MVRVLCLPDIDRPIGGVKQLYRHVEHLVAIGWDAAILTASPSFRPTWFTSSAPSLSLSESFLQGELTPDRCILLLPETYLNVDLSDFSGYDLSSLSRVVFNQNAYYSFGNIDDSTTQSLALFYDSPSVLHVLSVSEDTHDFLHSSLSISDSRLTRIINAIEPIFSPHSIKHNRMHWMPRKNPDHVNSIMTALQRCNLRYSSGWSGSPLSSLSHQGVADSLNSSRLFLSFGHPEGFGLPIAEAMAAGCWVVGYSGCGGSELFRFGASSRVEFGDWSGFLRSIQNALELFETQPREMQLLLQRQSLAVSTLYSKEQERLSIMRAWDKIRLAFQQFTSTSQN